MKYTIVIPLFFKRMQRSHDMKGILKHGFPAMSFFWNGGTPKSMVYNGKSENPMKMDDLGVAG